MSTTKIDAASQISGVLPRAHGGTDNAQGAANNWLIVRLYNDFQADIDESTVVTKTNSQPFLHPTTTAGEPVIGVVVGSYPDAGGALVLGDCAEDDMCAVVVSGFVRVLTSSTAAVGQYLRASATDGVADPLTTKPDGAFGYVTLTESATACHAMIGNVPAQGATAYGTPAIVLGTAAAAGSASTGVRTDATIIAFDTNSPTTIVFGDSAAVGTAAIASRRDHKHGIPVIVDSTPPTTQAFGDSADVGAATVGARRDHKHGIPAIFDGATPTTQAFADSPVVGTSAYVSHVDHKHGMPATSASEILIVDTPSTPLVFADLVQNDDQNDLLYAD